jgi:hypothetical protein
MDNPAEKNIAAGDEQQGNVQPQRSDEITQIDSFRSLTRLLIGGVEVGYDELVRLLQIWEQEVSEQQSDSLAEEASDVAARNLPFQGLPAYHQSIATRNPGQPKRCATPSSACYSISGARPESAANLGKIERSVWRLANPMQDCQRCLSQLLRYRLLDGAMSSS